MRIIEQRAQGQDRTPAGLRVERTADLAPVGFSGVASVTRDLYKRPSSCHRVRSRGGNSLTNERLRRAIGEAGLQLEDVAAEAGIDVKTAERWVTKGRVPHPRNR